MKRVKNSVGIWAFGANATRFMPDGYHVAEGAETMVEKTRRAVVGLNDLVDGFEYHFPGEVDEDTYPSIKKALDTKDLYAIALGTFNDPKYHMGTFVNPDPALRAENLAITKRAIDLAAEIGAKFIIWPGGEGYNYNFQVDYVQTWEWFINGMQEAVEYANACDVTVLLEHKNSEPAMNILMRNIGMALFTIHQIKDRGTDITNLKINMDWQHLIMNGENLGEYAALLAHNNLLGHHHANSGWGTFDDDNITGASFFMQTLELAKVLQRANYGANGERIGADLFPYTEDQVQAVRRALLQWEFIWDLAAKIDDAALEEAWRNKDAVRGQEIVYEVLGLDGAYVDRIIRDRKSLG